MPNAPQFIEILLVENNDYEAELTRLLFAVAKVHNRMHIVKTGEEALDFLYRRGAHSNATRPDIVFIDRELPRMRGDDVIAILRNDLAMQNLPLALLTNKDETVDPFDNKAQADFIVTKPMTLLSFINAMQATEKFWIGLVRLADDETMQRKAS